LVAENDVTLDEDEGRSSRTAPAMKLTSSLKA